MAKICKILLFIFICFSFLFSQKEYVFSEEEVKSLFNSIKNLERKDSLNVDIINNLEIQIKSYSVLQETDSIIISELENQITLQKDLISIIKPKWYENKYLWFIFGLTTTRLLKL